METLCGNGRICHGGLGACHCWCHCRRWSWLCCAYWNQQQQRYHPDPQIPHHQSSRHRGLAVPVAALEPVGVRNVPSTVAAVPEPLSVHEISVAERAAMVDYVHPAAADVGVDRQRWPQQQPSRSLCWRAQVRSRSYQPSIGMFSTCRHWLRMSLKEKISGKHRWSAGAVSGRGENTVCAPVFVTRHICHHRCPSGSEDPRDSQTVADSTSRGHGLRPDGRTAGPFYGTGAEEICEIRVPLLNNSSPHHPHTMIFAGPAGEAIFLNSVSSGSSLAYAASLSFATVPHTGPVRCIQVQLRSPFFGGGRCNRVWSDLYDFECNVCLDHLPASPAPMAVNVRPKERRRRYGAPRTVHEIRQLTGWPREEIGRDYEPTLIARASRQKPAKYYTLYRI
uniref:Uncharacterized protein n=1 Tax=Anopheles farauti TaxID=69004 RepID=A0A182QSM9_9DIPT